MFRMAAREGCWRALDAAALGDIASCEELKDKYANALHMRELQIYLKSCEARIPLHLSVVLHEEAL